MFFVGAASCRDVVEAGAYSAEVALATKAGSLSHKKFSFEMLSLEMKVFQGVHPWNC
jgi:hypothetical protein